MLKSFGSVFNPIFLRKHIIIYVALIFAWAFVSLASAQNTHAATLTISASDVSIDVKSGATVISGSPVNVATTCSAGYTFSIATSSNDTSLHLNGASGSAAAFNSVDGTSTLANSTNRWGYYYNDIATPTTSSVFSALSAAPTILKTPGDTASNSDINDTFSIYYGVNAADSVAPGQYKMLNNASLQYFAVTDPSCSSYTIVYDGNNANAGTTMSIEHANVILDDEITLYASNYKKAGYGFAGWSTVQLDPDSTDFNTELADAVSDGLVFGPNETITFSHAMAKSADQYYHIKLYAIWVKPSGNMQNWECPDNINMPIGSILALTDTRDNQVYTVAKLADEHCWMTENLRLGVSGSNDAAKSQGFDGVFAGLAASESANFIGTSSVANSLYSTDGSTTYTISGSNQSHRFPRFNSDNTASATQNMSSADQNIYSYGNYYSWPAAAANTNDINSGYEEVNTSICPSGWTLPIGQQTTGPDSFGALSVALGGPSDGSAIASTTAAEELSMAFRAFPNNFVYSGRFSDSAVGAKNTTGAYWTKTTYAQASYYFYFTNTDVRPATGGVNKGRGNTVRCVKARTYHLNYNKNASDATGAGAYGYAFNYKGYFKHGNYTTTVLRALNYKRDGYGFAGWSTDPDVASHINESNHSYIYGPEETITTSDNNLVSHADENDNITLYAVWVPSVGNMQNWNGCSSLNTGNVTALTDTRDNQTYAVAKLADGRCWTIENSRLDPSSANITAANTNNPTSTFITQAANSSSLDIEDWCDGSPSHVACSDKVAFMAINYDALSTISDYTTMRFGFGVYYNWYTATAGNGTYTGSNVAIGTGQATGDICPAGWHLPTGGPSSEQDTYRDTIAEGQQYLFPNNNVHSGVMTTGSSISGLEINFFHYSSNAKLDTNGTNSSNAYTLTSYNNTYADSSGATRKTRGTTIRCINGSRLQYKISTMTKGVQTAADLKAVITTPTSSNPQQDTSNSGVYTYDASTFGTSSDENNDRPIYYYRGILDSNLDGTSSTYGSAGNGAYYPNYVKLTTTVGNTTYNTCWRIMRTTGSGGVKMIYNGIYGATTANSCANAQTNARLPDVIAYGVRGSSNQATYWYRNINRVGYTFNNATSIRDSATSTAVGTVFGNSSNYDTTNTTNSNLKTYLENYFDTTLGTTMVTKLEQNPGLCNDRSVFSNAAGTTAITNIVPYSASATAYFGGYARHINTGGKPTLNCSRGVVDIYSSYATQAIEQNAGNNLLRLPIGLPTADELALTGNGYAATYGSTSTYSSNYSYNSYIRHGGGIWTSTPSSRTSSGESQVIVTATNGSLYGRSVGATSGVRPVISLVPETMIVGGAGTATNPWIVE